ncbi:MAG: enoyl-CoA hydratase [Candidatus Melainabacteria bacterium]|nr:MAG: enoyl-CoA hydratase [Candidatus Melainabacteria bacterium]
MSISLTIEDDIATLLINRGEQKNAISLAMWHSIPDHVERIVAAKAKVLVVRGAAHTFSAGADLSEIANLTNLKDAMNYWIAIRSGVEAIAELTTTTIALIEGHCIGGGCLIALACDLRMAASNAQFALPEVKLGIVCDSTSVARLAHLIGGAAAKEMLLSGDVKNAEQAFRLGLVNEIVLEDRLVSRTYQLARVLARNNGEAIARLKRQFHNLSLGITPSPIASAGTFSAEEEDGQIAESFLAPAVKEKIKQIIGVTRRF